MGTKNDESSERTNPLEFDAHCRSNETASLKSTGEAELRYRQLVECAPDAYIVSDPTTTLILDVNQAACASLGYARSELLRLSVPDISPELDHSAVRRIWDDVRKGEPISFETTLRRKDGTTFPVEIRVGVTGSGPGRLMLGLARDITERKRAETELRASEKRYRNLVEHAPDAFFVVNPDDGSILDVNEVACRWLDYTRDELLRLKVMDIDNGAGLGSLQALWSEVQSGNVKLLETQATRRDGSEFPIELRAGRTDHDGHLAMHVLVRDLSTQRRAEIGQRRVFSTLSHEIRSALSLLTQFGDDMLDSRSVEVNQDQLARILRLVALGVDRLVDMSIALSDWIELIDGEHGKVKLNRQHVTVASLVDAAIDEITPRAQRRSQTVDVNLDDAQTILLVDVRRLHRALTTAFYRAINRSRENGKIRVKGCLVEGFYKFTVIDDGAPVSPEEVRLMFDPFALGAGGTTPISEAVDVERYRLATAKGFIELLGGEIYYALPDEPESGIVLKLPVAIGLLPDSLVAPRP